MSQSSAPSRGVDDMIGRSGKDPRTGPDVGRKSILKTDKTLNLANVPGNQDFYRQNEAIFKQIPIEERFCFDKLMD